MGSFGGGTMHCLRNLANFRGRDSRSQFWFYILALFLAEQAFSIIGVLVLTLTIHNQPTNGDFSINSNGVSQIADLMTITIAATTILSLILLGAAVVRRLHDRGLSGVWGLIPVPFLIFSSVQMVRLSRSFALDVQPDVAQFQSIFISNAMYLLMLVVLVALLVKGSDPGANRFGPPPLG